MKRRISLLGSLVLVVIFVSSCAAPPTVEVPTAAPATVIVVVTATPGPATPVPPTVEAPTAAPATVVVVVTATPVPPTPTAAATAAPTPVAQLPDGAVSQKGRLLVCTDFPYPPQEYYDENGVAQGSDVEIGTEIAARLGLQVEFVNSVFDSIIAAVTSGKCDIIISAQNITTGRLKQVNMIPYFQAGQSMVAAKGNPENISTPMDLCGKSAAAESGTTEADYLAGTGDYAGKGLTQACTKAGKKPIEVVVAQKDTDALQQLQAGKVAVYFADSPVAAYYTVQHPDQFQLVGQILEPVKEGISVPCGVADCTKAPLTPLGQGVETALKSMLADGTYGKILAKWNMSEGAVTLP
jgi:polar amino acid transport system substrate-binding protein